MRTTAKAPAAEARCEQCSVGAAGAGGERGGARLRGGAEGGLRGALWGDRRAGCAGRLQRHLHSTCRVSQACQRHHHSLLPHQTMQGIGSESPRKRAKGSMKG